MPAPTRLSIYNGALLVLKQRRLEAVDENLPYRHDLDAVWDDGGRERCLAAGLWNFATRTRQLNYEPSITPTFGYSYAFEKPTDLVALSMLSADGYFHEPFRRYRDEAGYWWADLAVLYVSYVSNDSSYGLDMGKWPTNFTAYVEHYFAWRIAGRVQGADPDDVAKSMNYRLGIARGTDARDEAVTTPPRGSWHRARTRGSSGSNERGL